MMNPRVGARLVLASIVAAVAIVGGSLAERSSATATAPQGGATRPATDFANLQPGTETASRTIEDGGTGPYKAVAAGDSTLPTHTIFRPKDLTAFGKDKKLPIVTWGNGACANTPNEHQNFLSEIASHGYLIIAVGPAQQAGGRGAGGGPARGAGGGRGAGRSGADPQLLLNAIDWAIAQNKLQGSVLYEKLDSQAIAAAGMSCGGLQALAVSPDPRIKTTIVCNSGIFIPAAQGGGRPVGGMPNLTKEHLKKLHSPVLYILGGPTDIAYTNGMDDFKQIEKLPAFAANMEGIGHAGTYGRPHGGEFSPVARAWLDWNLKGDAEAAKMFTGATPGLAKDPIWKVEKKNIP